MQLARNGRLLKSKQEEVEEDRRDGCSRICEYICRRRWRFLFFTPYLRHVCLTFFFSPSPSLISGFLPFFLLPIKGREMKGEILLVFLPFLAFLSPLSSSSIPCIQLKLLFRKLLPLSALFPQGGRKAGQRED